MRGFVCVFALICTLASFSNARFIYNNLPVENLKQPYDLLPSNNSFADISVITFSTTTENAYTLSLFLKRPYMQISHWMPLQKRYLASILSNLTGICTLNQNLEQHTINDKPDILNTLGLHGNIFLLQHSF